MLGRKKKNNFTQLHKSITGVCTKYLAIHPLLTFLIMTENQEALEHPNIPTGIPVISIQTHGAIIPASNQRPVQQLIQQM